MLRALCRGDAAWPLFMHGPPGCGKTCAALALLDYVDGNAWFYTASSWVDEMMGASKGQLVWRAEAGNVTVTPGMLERRIKSARLIVLDELATRDRVGDWHYECVKNLVDWRSNKPLIVLSNHGPAQVSVIYDDRLASRITAGTGLKMTGEDKRQK